MRDDRLGYEIRAHAQGRWRCAVRDTDPVAGRHGARSRSHGALPRDVGRKGSSPAAPRPGAGNEARGLQATRRCAGPATGDNWSNTRAGSDTSKQNRLPLPSPSPFFGLRPAARYHGRTVRVGRTGRPVGRRAGRGDPGGWGRGRRRRAKRCGSRAKSIRVAVKDQARPPGHPSHLLEVWAAAARAVAATELEPVRTMCAVPIFSCARARARMRARRERA